ncbi:MAG: nucleotide exchange factor GrpE [Crocinitomicaceae bacterium]|nr:nucleotide exchange factor GrpE [Flavobacteriales bacterium]NQZ36494.1 nucleotide exchange factor GrpE [Crocinitomicaceae bacterium]
MSEDKELKNEQDQMDQVNENQEQEAVETETPKEPTFEDKYNELNDKYLRIHAEFDNYRKRTNKEKIDIIGSANAALLKDLLPVMDDFERAMANNENIDDVQGMKEGISLIFNKFKMTLENKGLKPMVVDGEVFDAEIHEAIANIPAPKKKLKGKVIEAVEKGYYLNEKVIRYAKVVVGQ